MIALVGASAWIWQRAGSWREGSEYCERAIALLSSQTPAYREVRLQMEHAVCRPHQWTTTGLAAVSRAIHLCRETADHRGLFDALILRTLFLCQLHHTNDAETSCAEARSLIDKNWGSFEQQSLAFAESVILMRHRRWSEAARFCEEIARLNEARGDEDELVRSLTNLAYVALCSGDYPKAIHTAQKVLDSVPIANLGEHLARGHLLSILGAALVESGRHDEALRRLVEARESLRRTGNVSLLLAHSSLLALNVGRVVESAYLLGRAESRPATGGPPHGFSVQRTVDVVSKRLRESMPEPELTRLLAVGSSMSDEEALRGILEWT
jgi:tetratricopeptide (TPR) repeat protein